MDFWIGLLGLVIGIVGLAGLFSERHRQGWVVKSLIIAALVFFGFIWLKSYLEESEQRRLIEAAEENMLEAMGKYGRQSFEQLFLRLNYQDYETASKAIDDLVERHKADEDVINVKDEAGRTYTVRVYDLRKEPASKEG